MTQVKGVNRTYFRWGESLSDTYGYSECTGKQRSLRHARENAIYELADPYNATIDVYVQLCHQFGKRKAGELFYDYRSAQC